MHRFDIFKNFPELIYGASHKKDGSMRMQRFDDGTTDLEAPAHRQKFFEFHDLGNVFVPTLMHGNEVSVITKTTSIEKIKADGFITRESNLTLTITVADCFPVYFYDPATHLVGLAHCGWRSIVGNLPTRMIEKFCELGARPEDIIVMIGPGILKCHFTVQDDVIAQFKGYEKYIEEWDGAYAIDLSGIITEQLKRQGIKSIERSERCTYCNDSKYFSSRREGRHFGVMLAYISRKEN